MDNSLSFVVLALVACLAVLPTVAPQSYTCYDCNSLTNGNCGEPFNAIGVPTCNPAWSYSCQKSKYMNNGVVQVVRTCAPIQGVYCNWISLGMEGCYCAGDKCNSASGLRTMGPVVTALLSLVVIIFVAKRLS